ncbi:unnamed protein product, partial [Effrenium voratum]
MSSTGSAAGPKVRLNVVALIGAGTVGKLLVCIDEDAIVEDLASKIRAALARARVEGRLLRLTNTKQAHLPGEERVGDVLRDGEEVLAVLVREPEDPAARQQLSSGLGNALSFTRAAEYLPAEADAATLRHGRDACRATVTTEPLSVKSGLGTVTQNLPGPVEIFEEDVGPATGPATSTGKERSLSRRNANEWEVEKLTSKLREYVVARFREMHEMPADPGHHYVIVSLRPKETPGSVVAPMPIHYSVARVDIIEFERLCGRRIQENRTRLDFFKRCLEALHSLLDRGASREDYAPNMLPYSYKPGEEFSSLLHEVDESSFGQVEGFRPLIVIDTAGAVGQHLVFVKAAIKRLMYSFIVAKSRFNIIAFTSKGSPVAWEDRLMPPAAQKLREAEQFIDKLQPSKRSDILEAMRWALESGDADTIYLLTSGFPKRADVDYCRADIRSRNLRQLPLHVIGVECAARAEVELRRLAEENRGTFRKKTFEATSTASCYNEMANAMKPCLPAVRTDQRLSIGGQVEILEVMVKEQEVQTTDWLEEQTCANRILLSSASQQPVPDPQQARYAAGRLVVNELNRCAPPPLRELLTPNPPKGRGRGPSRPSRPSRPGGREKCEVRRPSVHNPWDRPSGVLKASQATMGRVHQIVVENFKSYQGKVTIGPFRKFTCIIGPNGAGKSNLMDAISFVLGVQARQLRGERARDLVYRTEKEDPKKNQRVAYVELSYVDDEVEGEQVLVFRRVISRTGEAKFQVNNVSMSQADYLKRLEGINILSKVRNFLVFQGDVEATAQRQGKDLTAFFEQISGSDSFRQEYESLASEKNKLEERARYLFSKKRSAVNERKRVSQQKEEADEYKHLQTVRKDLQREFTLFRLHGLTSQMERAKSTRSDAIKDREAIRTQMESEKQKFEEADRSRAKARLETQQVEKQLGGVKAKLEKFRPERVTVQSRLYFLQQRLEELSQSSRRDGQRRGKLEEQLAAIRAEEARLEAQQEALKQGLAERKVSFTPAQLKDFEKAKQETEKITAGSSDALRQLDHQIRALRAERIQSEGDERDALARRKHLQQRLQELAEVESSTGSLVERGQGMQEDKAQQLASLRGASESRAEEKQQLQQERQQLLEAIQDFTASEQQLEREREISAICASLMENHPGVYGRIVDLCKPSQKRLHVAVNVAIGKFLDAIVVDDSETAKACVRYLKERMLPPMTFLPMADLRVPALDPRLQNLVHSQRGLRLGLNCVSFDEMYAKAFNFVLGDVVVADTMADGRRVAFEESRKLKVSCK